MGKEALLALRKMTSDCSEYLNKLSGPDSGPGGAQWRPMGPSGQVFNGSAMTVLSFRLYGQ
eukprot:106508-Hanusia_phi.AAC.2